MVLADNLFGTVAAFREQFSKDGRSYCVVIDSTRKVIAAEADLGDIPKYTGSSRSTSMSLSVMEWALEHAADFRTVTRRKWFEGQNDRTVCRVAGSFRPHVVIGKRASGTELAARGMARI